MCTLRRVAEEACGLPVRNLLLDLGAIKITQKVRVLGRRSVGFTATEVALALPVLQASPNGATNTRRIVRRHSNQLR